MSRPGRRVRNEVRRIPCSSEPPRTDPPRGLTVAAALAADDAAKSTPAPPLTADQTDALNRISADSLRGHLSFLASDLLEGRDTPSRGLDVAAEYIAAQFRRAGLEPAGDDGYFQTAVWKITEPDAPSFTLTLKAGETTLNVPKERVSLRWAGPIDVPPAGLVKVDVKDEGGLEKLGKNPPAGKALVVEFAEPKDPSDMEARRTASLQRMALLVKLRAMKPALILAVGRQASEATGLTGSMLIDPDRPGSAGFRGSVLGPPVVTVHDPKAVALLDKLPEGATVEAHMGEPVTRPVKLRNVAGLLRGSDPKLKDTYVLVTAHYDHIGVGSAVGGDSIYNGANDDGSGTVSVVEVASALGSLKQRPARSILFLTFFGEEKGLLGSRHYGRHPLVPVFKTVADVNLEQVGRTDSSEGPQVNAASMTGFDFSEVGTIFQAAGEAEGVKVFKHPRNSDAFFGRSDNQALADLGVPAHTLCVAYVYPDYHGAADHWDKVDYANMARIDRVVARALLAIASNPEPPRWNEANPKAKRYREAYQKLIGK
ncbi:MAG: M28 family peptidase [Isosphaeraceae bacterium]